MKEGQITEDEMYSNTESSENFDEFMNLLGEKIQLNGWKNFAGGLDTKSKSIILYFIYH